MTRIIIATLCLAWAIIGCGAAEEPKGYQASSDGELFDTPEVYDGTGNPVAMGGELGVASSAFSATGSFGVKQNAQRCSANSTCFVPKTSPAKKVQFGINCAGCSTDQAAGMDLGVAFWQGRMGTAGYATTKKAPGSAGELVQIVNDTSVLDILFSLNGPQGQDHVVGNITYRPFTHCTAKIDLSEDVKRINDGFYGDPAVQCLAGSTCRKNIFASHVVKALGHCSGLGDNPTAFDSAMSLPPYGQGSGATVNIKDFNQGEKGQLLNYQQ